MGILDANIANNLFKHTGSAGTSLLSSKALEAVKNGLFARVGENNFISARGFLGSTTTRLVREVLFTRAGITSHFDPVWKLTSATVFDPSIRQVGDPNKTVPDDLGGSGMPKTKFNYTVRIKYRDRMNNNLVNTEKDTPVSIDNDSTQSYIEASSLDDVVIAVDTNNNRHEILTNIDVTGENTTTSTLEGSTDMNAMEFAIKTVSRPQPTINYQDVNFYNYRTKIATKMDYGTITLTFYDDIRNRAHDIFDLYLKSVSPIANVAGDTNVNLFKLYATDGAIYGLNSDYPDVSSIGRLANSDAAGLIEEIIINHHLPLRYEGKTSEVSSVNHMIVKYVYTNPKITTMVLDDLDMTSNETPTVTMTFAYDSVYIDKSIVAIDKTSNVTTNLDNSRLVGGFGTAIQTSIDTTTASVTNAINNSTLLKNVKGFI